MNEKIQNKHLPMPDPALPSPIPMNGFQQIVDMLRVADPAFRESLLRRLAAKDHKLATSLRQDLMNSN